MMKKMIIIILMASLCTIVFAEKKPFTIEDLYRIKSVSDPQVSPDGEKIAFVVTSYNLQKATSNSDIYMINSDGKELHKITSFDGSDYHPRWSPDGNKLMFLSDRENGAQIWLLSAGFAEPEQVTDISTGINNPEWMPDGSGFIFSTKVFPECGADDECNKEINEDLKDGPLQAHVADALLYRHWTSYSDGRYTHILKHDLAADTTIDLTPGKYNSPPFSLGGGAGFDISPDGKEICFISKRVKRPAESTNNDLFILNFEDDMLANITQANEAFDGSPLYSPNGKYIAYLTQTIPGYEADRFRLAFYDRKEKRSKILTEKFDNNVSSFQWSNDSKYIYFVAEEQGYYPVYRLELKSQKLSKVPEINAISGIKISFDGRWFYFTDRRVHQPTELYKIAINGTKKKQLTFLNQKIVEEVDIRPAEQMWIEGADNTKIHVFIIKPHNFDPYKKYPLIVNVHGGPQMQWSDSFRGDWQVYPGAGYVVAFPNPHGSTGYGQEFTAAISKDWNGKVIADVIKVTKYLATLEYIDEDRIGAMGWSWGGYAMNWLEGHNDEGLFKCFVSMMGVYDLRSMYGATEELWFPEWDIGGTPWSSENYETMSPSNYVEFYKTPMLLLTGERDYRVPYTQSLHFFTDLQKMNVESRLIVFKNDGHWPNFVKSMPFYYNAHLDWFHKYLGGDKAPWDMEKMFRNQIFDSNE